jgi:hypothetical protein
MTTAVHCDPQQQQHSIDRRSWQRVGKVVKLLVHLVKPEIAAAEDLEPYAGVKEVHQLGWEIHPCMTCFCNLTSDRYKVPGHNQW